MIIAALRCAVALVLFSASALPKTVGDWDVSLSSTENRFTTRNTHGDEFTITCGDESRTPRANFKLIVEGHPVRANATVYYFIGKTSGQLTFDDDANLDTWCTACESNYSVFWHAMRSGNKVSFQIPDHGMATFSLRGSTAALPSNECPSELASRIGREQRAKSAKPKPATETASDYATDSKKLCRAKWPDDYEMQLYCHQKQRDGLLAIKRLQDDSSNDQKLLEDIFVLCGGKWTDDATQIIDWDMTAYCMRKQFDAAKKLGY